MHRRYRLPAALVILIALLVPALPLLPEAGPETQYPRFVKDEWAAVQYAVANPASIAASLEYQRQGRALAKQGKHAAALPLFEAALDRKATDDLYLDYADSLLGAARYPECVWASYVVINRQSPKMLSAQFTIACASSRQRNADLAFDFLDACLEGGFKDLAVLRTSPHLAFVRSTSRWSAWYAAAEGKLGGGR